MIEFKGFSCNHIVEIRKNLRTNWFGMSHIELQKVFSSQESQRLVVAPKDCGDVDQLPAVSLREGDPTRGRFGVDLVY